MTDPDGNQTVHAFSVPTGAMNVYEAETKNYSGSTSGTLLKTIDMTYSPIGTYCISSCSGNYMALATVTTTWPTSPATVSETCIYYDNQTKSGSGTCPVATISSSGITFYHYGSPWGTYEGSYGSEVERDEYDYGSGSPGTTRLRKTTTQWQWQGSSSYMGLNFLDRPNTVTVYDGSNSVAGETTYLYDESSRSSCSYPACGDLTTVHAYYDSSDYVTTHTNYNSYGMRTATIDGNGNQTSYSYDSTGAFLSEIDYPTTGSGTAHSEQFQYDDFATTGSSAGGTGLLNWHKDQNGQEISYTYDSMRRITSASYPDGGAENYSYVDTVSYPSSPNFTYTKKITSSSNFVGEGIVDGLGRKIRTITTVDSSTCSGTVYVVTTYDNEGRIASVSNPECSLSGTDKIQYAYDSLSRVTTVTQQDGGTVQTSYTNYPCTTTTDEASKARKSCADAAGRMTGVWEDPSSLNYETDYSYDTNNNLTQVQQQGGDSNSSHWRTRTFAYDFLSRLHSATTPESSATCYGTYSGSTCQWNGYDANSNLLYKTDARGITTTSTYDALNRLTQKSYSDSTPTVNYAYDGVSPTACTISFTYGSYPKPQRTAICATGRALRPLAMTRWVAF